MKNKIELLAPGGGPDAIKAAILAGADAVYCGLDKFNARNRAENISLADLNGIVRLAHQHDCKIFLTLNIIILESEIPALIRLLNKLVNTKINGVIVQDLGLLYLLSTYFPTLSLHGSTQLTTHNKGQIEFLKKLQVSRVNISRELSLEEITGLSATAHVHDMLMEVFVHGSNCLCFSGLCYMSSVISGHSGNRGRCSQPCRDRYVTTETGWNFPLNLKDNSVCFDLRELLAAGVDSVKIEGRIKKFHYVYTVVDVFRKQLRRLERGENVNTGNKELYQVFNRDFTNGYLQADISREMFIDNPRDHSALHLAKRSGDVTVENIEKAKRILYDLKTDMITDVKCGIERLSIARPPLKITVSGQEGQSLQIHVETVDGSGTVVSQTNLVRAMAPVKNGATEKSKSLDAAMLLKRFKAVNEKTAYDLESLDVELLQPGLFIPFKELSAIKNKILFILNDSQETIAPVEIPSLKKQKAMKGAAFLSVLVSSPEDLSLGQDTSAEIYFQLPSSLKNEYGSCLELCTKDKTITPWFSPVLIGDEYQVAVDFLQELQPKRIVANNTGIALAAYKEGIPWGAGPYLNIVNSFSLLCLKEKMNCSGAFISNEINRNQIKRMIRPDSFQLYYMMYQPILLMTSRQCLFHQVVGCEKNRLDGQCLAQCEKSATITNLNSQRFCIEKTKGNYHMIYNDENFLNTAIVEEVPDFFTSFCIDLRDIKTETAVGLDKAEMVHLFAKHLAGDRSAAKILKQHILPVTVSQYEKGL